MAESMLQRAEPMAAMQASSGISTRPAPPDGSSLQAAVPITAAQTAMGMSIRVSRMATAGTTLQKSVNVAHQRE